MSKLELILSNSQTEPRLSRDAHLVFLSVSSGSVNIYMVERTSKVGLRVTSSYGMWNKKSGDRRKYLQYIPSRARLILIGSQVIKSADVAVLILVLKNDRPDDKLGGQKQRLP